MKVPYACGSAEHVLARRQFLSGLAGVSIAGSLGGVAAHSLAATLQKQHKRVVMFNMHGGLSQLESWDPKPSTETGGPFRAIPTTVPGIHISELLPHTAQQMHHLTLVRGVNTGEDDHGKGIYMILRGRKQTPGADYPTIGAVAAKTLEESGAAMPGHVLITPGGGGRASDSAYLGPKYSSLILGNGNPPQDSVRPADVTQDSDEVRNEFRRKFDTSFATRRRTAFTEAYTQSYEQAQALMKEAHVFDVAKESERDQERYGKHDLGRQCLLARRLLENGVMFVQVTHSNYDTHNENFDFHLEQLGEFDRPFATLVADIADRGMLDSTLILVVSEFGRTPNINLYYGRDHFGHAWSIVMGGARAPRGAVYGKTNEKGTAVVDGQVNHAQLFHTMLQSVGVDSTASLQLEGRSVPLADPAFGPVKELLT